PVLSRARIYIVFLHDALPICEDKQPVLIIGGSGAGVVDADLIVVVLPGVLPQPTELESVIPPDFGEGIAGVIHDAAGARGVRTTDRKSTRMNSSHQITSYAVF